MNKTSRVSIWLAVPLLVSGCGVLKEVFPDKEKDYLYKRELPELVVPSSVAPTTERMPALSPAASAPVQTKSLPETKMAERATRSSARKKAPVAEPETINETVIATPLNEAPIATETLTKDNAVAVTPTTPPAPKPVAPKAATPAAPATPAPATPAAPAQN